MSAEVRAFYNDHMVTIKISFSRSHSFTADAWNTIATIPEKLRLGSELRFTILDNTSSTDARNSPMWARISSNGVLQIYAFSDRTALAPAGAFTYVKST